MLIVVGVVTIPAWTSFVDAGSIDGNVANIAGVVAVLSIIGIIINAAIWNSVRRLKATDGRSVRLVSALNIVLATVVLVYNLYFLVASTS
jgi:hypothetical protein